MTKRPPQEGKSSLGPENVWRAVTKVQLGGLGSLSWLGTKWVETMGDLGAEWLSFVADRIRDDVKVQHELMHARSLAEIQSIQAAFLQKTIQDYQAETGRMVEFCADTMAEIQAKADDLDS